MNATETPWWSYPDQMAALLRFLIDTDRLDPSNTDELVYVVSKPWKWETERAEMLGKRKG